MNDMVRLIEQEDITYNVRRINATTFQVASFDGHDEPYDVYTVTIRGSQIFCDCPGYSHNPGNNHKHVKIVRKFIELREPQLTTFWFDTSSKIHWYTV